MRLVGYFRSSAAQRVRIALNLKGIEVEHEFRHLRRDEHRAPDYVAINPQGLVPTLVTDDGTALTQSLAIIEWLEETHPRPPLLPAEPAARARVRAFALAIACEIHPLQNLAALSRVRGLGVEEAQVIEWARRTIADGLAACERMIAGQLGPFCFGDVPSLADICLVPQLGNARRFGVDLGVFPRLMRAEEAATALPAFRDAEPSRQPDAE